MKKPAPGPRTVRVIGKTFAIEYVEAVDDEGNSGEHRRDDQLIKIKLKQHPETLRETLLHEVIHAIDEQLDLGMKEQQVHRLAIGLFQVLRENGDFVRFITASIPTKRGK